MNAIVICMHEIAEVLFDWLIEWMIEQTQKENYSFEYVCVRQREKF